MNWLKAIIKSESVLSALKTLGKALITAALSTIGVTSILGCSIYGTGVGATV